MNLLVTIDVNYFVELDTYDILRFCCREMRDVLRDVLNANL